MLPGETVLSGCTLATTKDFEVCQSGAGWYVGTYDKNGFPCTRETGYFPTCGSAEAALNIFKTTGKLPNQRTT